jgi:transposase-like protein
MAIGKPGGDTNKSTVKEKSNDELEIIRLRKALHEAQIERDILKKAVCIYTKNDQ